MSNDKKIVSLNAEKTRLQNQVNKDQKELDKLKTANDGKVN